MCNDDRRVPSNQDLAEQLQRFEAKVDAKLGDMDHKIDDHRQYVEGNFVTVSAADGLVKEITGQVLREVSVQFRDMVTDAVRSAGAEIQHNAQTTGHNDFKLWYEQQQADDRKERRERWETVAGKMKNVVLYLLPLFTLLQIVLHLTGVV